MEFQAVVMAAGKGSRMTDLTAKSPKPLLPVGNMPMIWYPLQMLKRAGFEAAIVIVLESASSLIEEVLTLYDLKLRLEFVSIPDDEDWGTADSLRHIRDKITTDVLVVSCDLITDISLHHVADVHRTYDSTVTTLMVSNPDSTAEHTAPGSKKRKIERDFVGLDEKGCRLLFMASEADFEETVTFKKSLLRKHPCINIKSKLMDSHLYLMKKWVIDFLAEQSSYAALKGEVVPYLVKKQFSQAIPVEDKGFPNANQSVLSVQTSYDIDAFAKEDEFTMLTREYSTWNDHSGDMENCYHGNQIRCYTYVLNGGFCIRANTIASYCEANRQIPRQLTTLVSDKESQIIHPSATIHPKSQVGQDSMIAEGVTIAEKVSIKKSVIGKHCTIGEKVKITNSVVMDHVTIEEGSNIQGCIICENVYLNEKCELKDCLVGSGQNILAMSKFTNEVIVDVERMMTI